MSQESRLAVQVTKGDDYLNIWVDANNNGVRDDDDVNIFVTKTGNVFAQNANLKQAFDAHLKQRLQEAAVAFMNANMGEVKEEEICDLALEMVVKANKAEELAAQQLQATPEPAPQSYMPPEQDPNLQYSDQGIPMWRPLVSH